VIAILGSSMHCRDCRKSRSAAFARCPPMRRAMAAGTICWVRGCAGRCGRNGIHGGESRRRHAALIRTPAEEGGSARFSWCGRLFKDVDVVLHWHPGDRNSVTNGGMLRSFRPRSPSTALQPMRPWAGARPLRAGRSNADGNGIEFMREHVPSNSRMHYIITKGGVAPNIVPDLAQMDLVARNPSNTVLQDIWDRLIISPRARRS